MHRALFCSHRVAALLAVMALLAAIIASPLSAAQQAERVAVGDEAVDFTLQSIDGETYRLADLRGEKSAIVIFFRGTW